MHSQGHLRAVVARVWPFPRPGTALGMKSVMGKGGQEGGVGEGDWSSPLASEGEKVRGISMELSSSLGMLMEMISLIGARFGLGTENPKLA